MQKPNVSPRHYACYQAGQVRLDALGAGLSDTQPVFGSMCSQGA